MHPMAAVSELKRMKDDHQHWDCEYWQVFNTLIFLSDICKSDIADENQSLPKGRILRKSCEERSAWKITWIIQEWRLRCGNCDFFLSPDLISDPNQNFQSIPSLLFLWFMSKGNGRDGGWGAADAMFYCMCNAMGLRFHFILHIFFPSVSTLANIFLLTSPVLELRVQGWHVLSSGCLSKGNRCLARHMTLPLRVISQPKQSIQGVGCPKALSGDTEE